MNELLTAAQAAERLGCSVAQIKALCQEGVIPAEKFGRAWLIRPAALEGVQIDRRGWPAGKPRKPAG
jgi:excisionase family DNA binding protein